jgi:hypothetical protein
VDDKNKYKNSLIEFDTRPPVSTSETQNGPDGISPIGAELSSSIIELVRGSAHSLLRWLLGESVAVAAS